MATKELIQNLEQCSTIAVAGATIAVAIREQRQRKFSAGYLQNRGLQFPNLTYACHMLLFTLVFSYKRNTHHIEKGVVNEHRRNQEEKKEKSEFKGKQIYTSEEIGGTIWIQFSSFFTYPLSYSLIETMYSWLILCCLIFFFKV